MSALLQESHCWTHMTMVPILVHQQNSSSMSGGPLDPCLTPHKDSPSHRMWDLCPTPPLCPSFNLPVGNSSASALSHSHHWSPYLTCRTEWGPYCHSSRIRGSPLPEGTCLWGLFGTSMTTFCSSSPLPSALPITTYHHHHSCLSCRNNCRHPIPPQDHNSC